ncbi:hypothetical protein LX15_004390 [Streptoalloteichus tenebrarius]|uniref:Uncharacterized protein n=1 Tax=Streptoalloteichus tenebrarius (strain ATCC 17920 / DSM 40477 / JCM 4838 / CBS 697.72 / NBRC 16177 / NCIMB 11028 / NRRL B-12390 / A12253. 1 / ISP 5477) TaxID=1933 RepID=A0ABT1HYV3_STRSD|nr:hypothetical protein [Streptoalloteichus tenebrarius]MCP2260670.1 hypothetical protein [Streptoalloteichus tenebrarius]BFF03799.1 hypothetical protein GCM10020241_54740 [Streptoalloteichus tenebrarius]
MRRELGGGWSIDLDGAVVGRVVGGNTRFTGFGRTVWTAVWDLPSPETPADALAWIRQAGPPRPLRTFEEPGADDEELRYASWCRETENGQERFALHAYTLRPTSYVQAAFLVTVADDLDWALTAWRSLRYRPAPHHGGGTPLAGG